MRRSIWIYFWSGSTCALVMATVVSVAAMFGLPSSSATERLRRHCTFERDQLATITAKVFAFDPKTRSRGADLFADLEHDDWRGVALCVPEGVPVSRGCEPTDYACMASAVAVAALSMER